MRFFIIGSGRCGTTLLMRMLNCHPDLYVFNETHWIPILHEFFGSGVASADRMLDIVDNTRHVNGTPVTFVTDAARSELLGLSRPVTIPEFTKHLAESLMAESGKSIWGDKTPDYCTYIRLLHQLWPEARFIHVIRDGVAVARSMSRHPGYRILLANRKRSWVSLAYRWSGLCPETRTSTVDDFLDFWCMRVEQGRRDGLALGSDVYSEVRYESLLDRPGEVLGHISNFLGLSYDKEWLESAVSMVSPERVNDEVGHAVTKDTTVSATELMRKLGYGKSLH